MSNITPATQAARVAQHPSPFHAGVGASATEPSRGAVQLKRSLAGLDFARQEAMLAPASAPVQREIAALDGDDEASGAAGEVESEVGSDARQFACGRVRVIASDTEILEHPTGDAAPIAGLMEDTLLPRVGVEGEYTVVSYRGREVYVRTEAVSEDLQTEYEGDEEHRDTDIEVPSADQATAERLRARFPDGLNVAFYKNDYADGTGTTIQGAVEGWASAWDGVGARSGALDLGVANRAINAQEMVSGANAIVSAVEALTPRGIRTVDEPFLEPKIKNLAIGAHGLRGGLPGTGLGPRNAQQSDNPDESGNNCTRISSRNPPASCDEASEVDPTSEDDYDWNLNPAIPENIQPFVDGLRGYLTDDVAIHLLACNAAASPREEAPTGHRRPDATPGTEEDTTWGSYYAGAEPHGERSFAGLTQESLVEAGLEDASVSGHTQAGHGTRNLTVRFFGGEVAEGQSGGVDGLGYIFDGGFIQSEVERLQADASDAERERITAESVRSKMVDLYIAICDPPNAQAEEVQLARDIQMNPSGARDSIRGFWSEEIAPDAASLFGFRKGASELDDDHPEITQEDVNVRTRVVDRWMGWIEGHPIIGPERPARQEIELL